ncbi:MAG TPA: hypothetical protein VJ608_09910 [Albitalea sp.]|nr:hypothetical protein [Albitalea sp.]HJW11252.1 hypothetical protein [Albitalea sp.]
MNRVLSWPHTPIFPGLLEPVMQGRTKTRVTDKGTIRLDLPLGTVEMRFSSPLHQLAPGEKVVVWWKGGGFVCAPSREVEAEEMQSRSIAERVLLARAQLASARKQRISDAASTETRTAHA